MDKFKKAVQFVKENPWQTLTYISLTIAGAALVQTHRTITIKNYQRNEIERADQMFEWIAQAIQNGWQLAVTQEGLIDIIVPEVAA